MYKEVIEAADMMKAEKERLREIERQRDIELAEQYKKKLEEQEIARKEALKQLAERASKFQGNFIDNVLAKVQEKEAQLERSIKAHVAKIDREAAARLAEEKAREKARKDQMIKALHQQQEELRLRAQ